VRKQLLKEGQFVPPSQSNSGPGDFEEQLDAIFSSAKTPTVLVKQNNLML
jgi:hypothetical protein